MQLANYDKVNQSFVHSDVATGGCMYMHGCMGNDHENTCTDSQIL